MTPKVKEILGKYIYIFESKTQTHHPITKKDLLIKLGASKFLREVKAEPDENGFYPNAFYTADITDEEYEELLPYATLVNCTKEPERFKERFKSTLVVMMFILWIICIIGCVVILFTPLELMMKFIIIIGSIAELAFFQVFANAIVENAKNNKKASDCIVSLGILILKKNISQSKE